MLDHESEQQGLDPISHVFGMRERSDQDEIADRGADGDPSLMGVHHPGKLPLGLLPVRRQRQEIPIVSESDATEVRCSLQEQFVVAIGPALRLCGQRVDASLLHADLDRPWCVLVEIQAEADRRLGRGRITVMRILREQRMSSGAGLWR